MALLRFWWFAYRKCEGRVFFLRSMVVGNNSKRYCYFGSTGAPYCIPFKKFLASTQAKVRRLLLCFTKSDIPVKMLLVPCIAAGLQAYLTNYLQGVQQCGVSECIGWSLSGQISGSATECNRATLT